MSSAPADALQPFVAGDVFVGATLLNNPDDDHAGRGRILQFDADLNPKGCLWTEGTTHLVYGLNFAPDGVLWAFDPWAWQCVRVTPDGVQLPNVQFDTRTFSKALFPDDGSIVIIESMRGNNQPEPLTTRYTPMPGAEDQLGDGNIYRYTPDGELLNTYVPDIHGGMSGSMAVTHAALSKDGRYLTYVSETGPRLMRFDLQENRQLPDLFDLSDTPGEMFFDLARLSDDSLVLSRGNRLEVVSFAGDADRTIELEGFGWALVTATTDDQYVYAGNWFSGQLVKVNLINGATEAEIKVAEKCMAGIAVYK